ncbi:alcohol dehydrogenase catalytic domain-containing protein [Amycolatopsis silviterrae]|uniref:Alcohol dehydrogenase catalytic domain-containing protein n=1 Tax=Amycolatopsis silviterrae TaxID=1656914 RepID=A0ABW5H7E9_9PSEU
MRAAVLRNGKLVVDEVAEPPLGPGQLKVRPIAVGICGSDLSAWQHTSEFLRAHADTGMTGEMFDPDQDLVLGHEFTAEVLETGDGVRDYQPGQKLVVLPAVVDPHGEPHTLGYCTDYPGGLAEHVVVQAYGHLTIPESVSPVHAAVTEPMATGVNAVLRAGTTSDDGAIVTGCGPVGLGSIVELVHRGVRPIVASDPSERRRRMAAACGATAVVDPTDEDPVEVWRAHARSGALLHVFEASGARGLLDRLMAAAPRFTRILIVGAGMVPDPIRPVVGILKNVSLEFVGGPGLGETGYQAFDMMFDHIVAGRFDPASIVTGYAGLDSVGAVFEALRPQDSHRIDHVKVLVRHDITEPGILVA